MARLSKVKSTKSCRSTFFLYGKMASLSLIGLIGFNLSSCMQNTPNTASVARPTIYTSEQDQIFSGEIEDPPVPINGYGDFYKKIGQAIIFPDSLTEKGKVFIEFTVDTLGNIIEPRILKGYNELADKEALRAFSSVDQKLEPGRQRGKKVRHKMAVPITFDPESNKKK